MVLSDTEIKRLEEKAEALITSVNPDSANIDSLKQALGYYNTIIKNSTLSSYYFAKRADVNHMLGVRLNSTSYLNSAIADIDRAIEIEPDKGDYCRVRGFYRMELINAHQRDLNSIEVEQTLKDFRACISKEPTQPLAWLHMLALNVIRRDWDEVISVYGQCNPYIHDKEDLLMKSFFGCLALAFAGDPIEKKDVEPLHDKGIQLKRFTHVYSVSSSIGRLFQAEQNQTRKERAEEIILLFISHEESWVKKGLMLEQLLGNMEEALKAYEKEIELNNTSTAWNNKGVILEVHLRRPEEALECFKIAMQIDPSDRVASNNRFELSGLLFRRRVESTIRKLFGKQSNG